MNKKIGFIGGGNMGRAIIGGLLEAELYAPECIKVYDISAEALKQIEENLGVKTTDDIGKLIAEADIVVLSVKPQVLPSVLKSARECFKAEQLIISIAAGITISRLEEMLGDSAKIVRVMPNTPALVGEGMAGICFNGNVTEAEKEQTAEIFRSFGKAEIIPEKLIDAVVGVSGSSPAYVYMFIEALADGAVQEGMPRAQAYTFAAQAVLGSARMVLETGRHPGDLKDMVCSPAGTTIAAVKSLEKDGFRAAVMNAVNVAAQKNRDM